MLEMEGEFRVGHDVGHPIPLEAGPSGEVEASVELVEIDLDPAGQTRLPADRRDVGRATTLEGVPDSGVHVSTNRGEDRLVPGR